MIFLNFKKWIGNAPRDRRRVAQLIFKPYAPHSSSVGRNKRQRFVGRFEGEIWGGARGSPALSARTDRPPWERPGAVGEAAL